MSNISSKEGRILKRIAVGTIGNTVSQLVLLGSGFLLTPFILHNLGPADYGLWILVSSFIGYGQLLDLGIASAIIKYLPEYIVRNEFEQVRTLIATAIRLYTFLGLAAFGISAVFAAIFPDLFNLAPAQRAEASALVLLMGLQLSLSIISLPTYAILRGLQLYTLANLLVIVGTLLWASSTVLVLWLNGNLLAMVAVNIPITIIMQIVYVICIKRNAPQIKLGWGHANYHMAGKIGWYSLSIFLQDIGSRLQLKTDEIVIGATLPISFVTPYSIARRLSEIGQLLTYQFIKVLMPLASQLNAENDSVGVQKLYLASMRLALLVYLPLGSCLVLLSSPFLALWVGPDYAQYSYLVALLSLSGLILVSQAPVALILQGINRHHILAITSIISGLVNLALSLILVGPFGLAGVAIGTLIPTTIESLFVILPYSLRIMNISFLEVIKVSLLPPLLPFGPMLLTLFGLNQILKPNSYITIILIGAAGIGVYVVTYFLIGASKTERLIFYEYGSKLYYLVKTRRKKV